MNKPPTNKQIAERLGVSVRRVSQLKEAGLPSHNLDAAAEWKKNHVSTATDSAELLRQGRVKLVFQQERRAKLENDIRAGHLILRTEVYASGLAVTSEAKRAFLNLLNTLPPELCGLPSETAIFKVLRGRFYTVLENLSNGKYATPEIKETIDSFKTAEPSKL
jgi:hypothetical protein